MVVAEAFFSNFPPQLELSETPLVPIPFSSRWAANFIASFSLVRSLVFRNQNSRQGQNPSTSVAVTHHVTSGSKIAG